MKNTAIFSGTQTAQGVDTHSLYFSILSVIIFSCIGLFVLTTGHPHEDAYILYIYSENLADTGVISYFKGGEHAEGATDFLWMSVIAVLNLIGVNAAASALALNAVGVFLLTYMALRVGRQFGSSIIVSVLLSVLIPFYVTSQAAYAGFSVALYSSLVAVLFLLSIVAVGRQVVLVPVLGLLLALFRPDGAIFGVLTTLMLIPFVKRSDLKIFFSAMAICAAIGIAYFLWRWNYFGQSLPLPLIVKSHSDRTLPGLWNNLSWATGNILFIVLSIFAFFSLKQGKKRVFVMCLPGLTYMTSLCFAVQSQNIADRFQAPASGVLIIGSAIALFLIYEMVRESRSSVRMLVTSVMTIGLVVQLGISARSTMTLTRHLTNTDYVNFFPFLIADKVPDDFKIVLTEAGRFAYWLKGEKYDLVGLNTAATALHGASAEYISTISPDLVFFHHAGTISNFACPNTVNYCEVSSDEFRDILEKSGTRSYLESSDRVMQAAAAGAAYLADHADDFHLIFVFYGNRYPHVYGLRRSGKVTLEDFTSSLDASFAPEGRMSYFEMIRQR